MSKSIKELADENEKIQNIASFVLGEVGGADEVETIEENCGTLFIDTKDGKSYTVSIIESEKE